MNKPKILLLDIENFSLEADYGILLCVGYKELDEKQVHCPALWDFKSWNDDLFDDSALVQHIHPIVTSADAIVTHYGHFGNGHDNRYLNSKFLQLGLSPIPKIPILDTWGMARRYMKLSNNRLGNISEFLRCKQQKMKTNKQLWKDVLNRKPAAFKKMVSYCKQDVRTLEEVFVKLRPLYTSIPNYNLFVDSENPVCPNCGHKEYSSDGFRHTSTQSYRRCICKKCHSRFRMISNQGRPC